MIRLQDKNTRFELPIIHPITRETVSAEALYNSTCDALGYQVDSHIGDLILDNLDYRAGSHDGQTLCDAVYAWASGVRKEIAQ